MLDFRTGGVVEGDFLRETPGLLVVCSLAVCILVVLRCGLLAVLAVLTILAVCLSILTLTFLRCRSGISRGSGLLRVVILLGVAGETFFGIGQELPLLVEGVEVQTTIDVHSSLGAGGVTQEGTVFEFCTTCPVIVGGIGAISGDPVKNRDLVDWHLVGTIEGAAIGQRTSEGGEAALHGVFPHRILVWIEVLVDNHMWLFNLCMGGGVPRHLECLEDVPLDRQITVPQDLVGEDDRHLGACIDVTFLELIITAGEVGVERDALWQPLQVLCLDDVEPFGLALQVLEGFQRLVLGGIVIAKVEAPVLIVLVDGGLTCLIALAVTVAEREVGRVPWHGLTALHVRFPVTEREVLVLHNRFREIAEGVTCCLVLTLVKGILQQHVGVKRIILGRQLLPGVGVIEGEVHLPLFREELAQFQLRGDAPLIEVVIATLVHLVFQTAEACCLHMTGHVHRSEV